MNTCLKHLPRRIDFPESDCPTCRGGKNIREYEEKYGELTVNEFAQRRERGEL